MINDQPYQVVPRQGYLTRQATMTMLLPEELSLQVLKFLTIDDLAEAAQVSRQLRDDCRHHSLSQLRTATICCSSGSTENFVRTLYRMHYKGVFEKFRRLRIQQADLLFDINEANYLFDSISSNNMIKGIEYLDLSPKGQQGVFIRAGVLELLQSLMPDATDLNLTHCEPPPVALSNCHHLQVIRWTNQHMSVPLLGITLPFSPNLNELYMDESLFPAFHQDIVDLMCRAAPDELDDDDNNNIPATHRNLWIFQRFGDKLERVSIKNCRYCLMFPSTLSSRRTGQVSIPQEALIKFVRHSPSLQWLKSDLTPDNVAMLQRERPDVVFE